MQAWNGPLHKGGEELISAALDEGETIVAGIVGINRDALVITDRRVFAFDLRVLGRSRIGSWRHHEILAVDVDAGPMFTTVRLSAPPPLPDMPEANSVKVATADEAAVRPSGCRARAPHRTSLGSATRAGVARGAVGSRSPGPARGELARCAPERRHAHRSSRERPGDEAGDQAAAAIKRDMRAERRQVVARIRAERAQYRSSVAHRVPKMRGGGTFGSVLRGAQTISRAVDRANHDDRVRPMEAERNRIDENIAGVDGLILELEGRILAMDA